MPMDEHQMPMHKHQMLMHKHQMLMHEPQVLMHEPQVPTQARDDSLPALYILRQEFGRENATNSPINKPLPS